MARLNENKILSATLPYLQFIHDYHNETVDKGLALRHPDELGRPQVTTVFSTGIPFEGKIYEVPGYDRETGKVMSEDEVFEKYMPLLESGSLQEKYGDFGIPKANYKTIMNLYQDYKKISDYGNVPDSSVKYDMMRK
jgi:hypothetical protein